MKITAMYERTCSPNPENICRQKNNLTNVAIHYGFTNLQHYTDDGFTGFDDKRPGFTALMTAIKAGQVSVLLIRDYARLTRDYEFLSDLFDTLDLHSVRLISLNEKIDHLPPHIHDDDNGLDYELHGDYYFPMISLPPEVSEEPVLSKWAGMYRDYLKNEKPDRYNRLLITGKLNKVLADIDQQASERFDTLMNGYKQAWNITEALKADDPMRWVGLMNNARDAAEWNIMMEIVFC